MTPKQRAFWIVAVATVALDQATKTWVRTVLADPADRWVIVPGLFDLGRAENPGAAFSAFTDDPSRYWIFGVTTVLVCAVVLGFVRWLDDRDAATASGMGLVLGGVLGNAIDRVRFGTVTDFLRVHAGWEPARTWLRETVGTAEWPTFNVADSALVVGILGWLLVQAAGERDDALAGEAGPPDAGPGPASG